MDYKAVEKPPTPPASPGLLLEERGSNLHHTRSVSSPLLQGNQPITSSLYGTSNNLGSSLRPPLSPRLSPSPELDSPRSFGRHNAHSPTSLYSTASTSAAGLGLAASPSSAYPQPVTTTEKVSLYSREVSHRARLLLGQAGQSVINALPSPSSPGTPPITQAATFGSPSSPQGRRVSAPRVNGMTSPRRRLAGKASDRDRERDLGDPPPPAWHELLATISKLLPSLSTKRIRTRSRRLLIFLGCITLLCYMFSNTLREAYYSAAVERKQHILEELERERLGPHLTEFSRHPIDDLMENAKKQWEAKVARQSKTVDEGMEEYRRRYKREPPDGYREWYEYAKACGTVLIDEYDSLMASLEPFWALEPEELRRRTFQIGMQPSFALVHIEEGQNGGTFWDANENEELIKPFGVERARGLERMLRPFVGRPGMVNMVFAVNELAEPRVLVPWEEKLLIDEAIQNKTSVNLRQFAAIPGRTRKFFPDPVWKGDGTTWEIFMRTCPPNGKARRLLTAMTNNVVHLADTIHVAYKGQRIAYGKRKNDKIIETVAEGDNVEVQVNPLRTPKRRKVASPPALEALATEQGNNVYEAEETTSDSETERAELEPESESESEVEEKRPGEGGFPTNDIYLNTLDFIFNNNVTSLSHEALCSDATMHDTQGQFCSDFRALDSLYPVFSPSTMPGFSDVVIPSHYYASNSGKYHLSPHRKKVTTSVKDVDGTWKQTTVEEDLPAWKDRKSQIFWRGSTTGGGNNPAGRQLMYQRHRFVRITSEDSDEPIGVVLPASNSSNGLTYVELPSSMVNEQAMDVAFTSLDGCGHEKVCDAVRNGKYRQSGRVPLLDIAKYKMLIDIDGMAYSARFMALLESGAAVLKSTIYSEFYSDQIQPWYHYVPVSTLYTEIYNIYSYFLGLPPSNSSLPHLAPGSDNFAHKISKKQKKKRSNAGLPPYETNAEGDETEEPLLLPHTQFAAPPNEGAHDSALEDIGRQGQEWMNKFGQVKDMEIYCYRLALEWGRLWQRDGPIGTF